MSRLENEMIDDQHDNSSKATCGAKTRAGGVCKRLAMANGRCDFHGGKSLSGVASPSFRTGRYSKYLPERMLERYHAALEDPDLLNVRSEVALLDSRLSDLLQRVDMGASGALWAQLQEANERLTQAQEAGDPLGVANALNEMRRLIRKGHSDQAAWSELRQLVQDRRRLTDSQTRREVALSQYIPLNQVMAAMQALVESVKANVATLGLSGPVERAFLVEVQREFIRLAGVSPRPEPSALLGQED